MILIALGSSLPFCGLSPVQTLHAAIRAIGVFAPVVQSSSFYRTAAWPNPADPPFVNAVISVETGLGPEGLMAALHTVEDAFGRVRRQKNAPRTLDLDLLAYKREVRTDRGEKLALPHPGLAGRDFVLAPLCDIAPHWRCPATGIAAAEMLKALDCVEAQPLDA